MSYEQGRMNPASKLQHQQHEAEYFTDSEDFDEYYFKVPEHPIIYDKLDSDYQDSEDWFDVANELVTSFRELGSQPPPHLNHEQPSIGLTEYLDHSPSTAIDSPDKTREGFYPEDPTCNSAFFTPPESFYPTPKQRFAPQPQQERRPSASPISQEELIAEVKTIYAGLVMVETDCMDTDTLGRIPSTTAHPNQTPQLNNKQQLLLINLHKTLLQEDQSFSKAPHHLLSSLSAKQVASKDKNSVRWKEALDMVLKCLENRQADLNFEEAHHMAYLNISFSKILWRQSMVKSRDSLAQKLRKQWCLNSKNLFDTAEENASWQDSQIEWRFEIGNLLAHTPPPKLSTVHPNLPSMWDLKSALEVATCFFEVMSRVGKPIHRALIGLPSSAKSKLGLSETNGDATDHLFRSTKAFPFFGRLFSVAEKLGFEYELQWAHIMFEQQWLKCQEDITEYLHRLSEVTIKIPPGKIIHQYLLAKVNTVGLSYPGRRNQIYPSFKIISNMNMMNQNFLGNINTLRKNQWNKADMEEKLDIDTQIRAHRPPTTVLFRVQLDSSPSLPIADPLREYCNYLNCSFSATTKGNLTRHIAQAHEGVKYKCKFKGCHKTFTRSDHLRSHIRHVHDPNT
ncbi:hypothetical protein ABW20_dc0106557 [Dactylellina cionopaga]|nr:hypothetical protein ABW20_dc0106557 [Dactylellina cionopaga]